MNIITTNLRRIRHRLHSDSSKGFGIHSPFVFDFLTDVLNEEYQYYAYADIDAMSEDVARAKRLKLLYMMSNYYNSKRVLFVGDWDKEEHIFQKSLSIPIVKVDKIDADIDFTQYDFLLFDRNNFPLPDYSFTKDSIIVVDDLIYNSDNWENYINTKQNHIFMDFCSFGIIFARDSFQKYKFTF